MTELIKRFTVRLKFILQMISATVMFQMKQTHYSRTISIQHQHHNKHSKKFIIHLQNCISYSTEVDNSEKAIIVQA